MKLTSVEYIKGAADLDDSPRERIPEIAFIGRSNVGKSSLINFLLGRKVAFISSTPGKTQLIHFFKINRAFGLVDLPGYGYARAPEATRKGWGPMIEAYLLKREQLRGLVFLIDIRHPGMASDLEMKRWIDHYQVETLFVATKGDKIGRGDRKKRADEIKAALGISDLLITSTATKEGKETLWKGIDRLVRKKPLSPPVI